jgi:hypothetical protein
MQQVITRPTAPSINVKDIREAGRSVSNYLWSKVDTSSVVIEIPSVTATKYVPTFRELLRMSLYAIGFLTWFISAWYSV